MTNTNDATISERYACSVCGSPATHITRNLYREDKGDGTIAYAAAGDCFWRCDAHRQEAIAFRVAKIEEST